MFECFTEFSNKQYWQAFCRRAGAAQDDDEPDWMRSHAAVRQAADAVAADAARKARIAAAQARAKAVQQRRAARKVRDSRLISSF